MKDDFRLPIDINFKMPKISQLGGGTRFAFPPSNGRFAPCLPFSGGAWTRALRPRGHTPLDPPTSGSPRQAAGHIPARQS